MFEWNDDQMYPRIMALRKKKPNLKISLAVGGWNHEGGGNELYFFDFCRACAIRGGGGAVVAMPPPPPRFAKSSSSSFFLSINIYLQLLT